jgi:hypothetical protein
VVPRPVSAGVRRGCCTLLLHAMVPLLAAGSQRLGVRVVRQPRYLITRRQRAQLCISCREGEIHCRFKVVELALHLPEPRLP